MLAAFVLLGASSTMNYMFASSVGRTPFEGVVLGVVVVGVDVLKAVLAVVLAVAARERRWGFFCIGGFAFVLFSALSLTASFAHSGDLDRVFRRIAIRCRERCGPVCDGAVG